MWNQFWSTLIYIWRLFTGHTVKYFQTSPDLVKLSITPAAAYFFNDFFNKIRPTNLHIIYLSTSLYDEVDRIIFIPLVPSLNQGPVFDKWRMRLKRTLHEKRNLIRRVHLKKEILFNQRIIRKVWQKIDIVAFWYLFDIESYFCIKILGI